MDTKLFQLMSHLTPTKRESIAHHLQNPNSFNATHAQLYNTIHEQIAAPSGKLSKEYIYKTVFPNKDYHDQKMRLLCSQVLKRIEKLICADRFKELEGFCHLELLQFYKEIGLKSQYESQLNKSQKYFRSRTIKDAQFQDQLIMLEDEISDHLLTQKRNQELNIQQTLDQVDRAYLLKKLKYACGAYAHSSIYSIEYDMGLLDKHLELFVRKNKVLSPGFKIYLATYRMLKSPDDARLFSNYRASLQKHQNCFKKKEMRTIYLAGINVCIRRLNAGDQNFGRIGLEMYEQALVNKHLLINGKLSRYTYRNIAMMAIRAGDFNWAISFTEEQKHLLKSVEMKSAYHLNKALIYYYQNELEDARDNIAEADFKDHLIHLAAKTLQAKIYYQLKQMSVLHSHLDSMEMYIIRNKIVGYHRSNYKNFVSYLRKLSKLKPYDQERQETLKIKIEEESILTERSWFVEQIQKN